MAWLLECHFRNYLAYRISLLDSIPKSLRQAGLETLILDRLLEQEKAAITVMESSSLAAFKKRADTVGELLSVLNLLLKLA